MDSMYEYINELVGDPAFTIFTGDIISHHVWATSRRTNEELSMSSIHPPPDSPYP